MKETPSQRVRFAIEALKEFEARPNCFVDMELFRESRKYGKKNVCFACLGGAAAIKRFKLYNPKNNTLKRNSTDKVETYEYTLDKVRIGDLGAMFSAMNLGWETGAQFNRDMPGHAENPKGFYRALDKLAKDLEKAGY